MTRNSVLLVFGGESSEHQVSISSARNIYRALDSEKYEIYICYIDQTGKWWLLDGWRDELSSHDGVQLFAAPGMRGFVTEPGSQFIHPDVILPVLHGKNGEDGAVQGLAALVHVPIVGCDMTASAVCMDKILTKQILERSGIKTVDFVTYRKGEPELAYADVRAKLGDILFVKPSRAGSSVGISKVHDEAEFLLAIHAALQHDERVLIERAVSGREIETAVLGNPPHHHVADAIGEIIPGAEFYDYDDKYASDSASQTIIDAEMDDSLKQRIRDTSYRAYAALGCRGLARIDYLVEDGQPYVIEVNTFPGFTDISMYPKLWQASGADNSELIDKLITLALQ